MILKISRYCYTSLWQYKRRKTVWMNKFIQLSLYLWSFYSTGFYSFKYNCTRTAACRNAKCRSFLLQLKNANLLLLLVSNAVFLNCLAFLRMRDMTLWKAAKLTLIFEVWFWLYPKKIAKTLIHFSFEIWHSTCCEISNKREPHISLIFN